MDDKQWIEGKCCSGNPNCIHKPMDDKNKPDLPPNFGKVDYEEFKKTLNLKKHMKLKRLLEWISGEITDEEKSK